MVLLLTQGLAELVQRRLDLIGECLCAVLGGVENSPTGSVQKARQVALERLQFVTQIACIEHRAGLCCLFKPEFYVTPRHHY